MEELYKAPNIVVDIKTLRLRWLGHMERMGNIRVQKNVLNMKPDGSRSVGRPRLRWLDNVEDDLCRLGIRNWRWLTASRDEWQKQIVNRALAGNDDDDEWCVIDDSSIITEPSETTN